MAYQYSSDYGLTAAVIDCITRDGAHNLSVELVAKELRRSRSALYQQFGSLRRLLKGVHEGLLLRFNAHCSHWDDDRRGVFDRWWNAVAHDLRTPLGAAFRELRGLVAERGGCEMLALEEVRGMPWLIRWLDTMNPADGSGLVAHRLWTAQLAAAPFIIGSPAEQHFRRLAEAELEKLHPPQTAENPAH